MENKENFFNDFLLCADNPISMTDLAINIVITIILTLMLSKTYIRCGKSLSNRANLAEIFTTLAITAMLIVTIAKSSLALAIGLIGALSVLRFRTAIKEPEEITHIFIAISIGVGLAAGANYRIIVITCILVILSILWIRFFVSKKKTYKNYLLAISASKPQKINLTQIVDIVEKHFNSCDLKRFDENENIIETSFIVNTKNVSQIQNCKSDIEKLSPSARISIIDNKIL